MKTIVICPYPMKGHYLPVFSIADDLKHLGFNVLFLGPAQFKKTTEAQGFSFEVVSLDLRIRGIQKYYKYGHKYSWIESLGLKRKIAKENSVAFLKGDWFDEIISAYSPSFFLIDYSYSPLALMLLGRNQRVSIIQTWFPIHEEWGIPPINSLLKEGNNFVRNLLIWLKWRLTFVGFRFNTLIELILHGKYSQMNTLSISLKNWGLDRKMIVWDTNVGFRLRSISEIYTVPECLDYKRNIGKNNYYLGSRILMKTDSLSDFENEIISLVKSEKEGGKKIIYASFGTQTKRYEAGKIDKYYRKIENLSSEMRDAFVVVTSDDSNKDHYDKKDNLLIVNRTPQYYLLQYVDVMITHGGINSILECVENLVPVLGIPLSEDNDQRGNIRRIQSHGLGTLVNMNKVSPKKLADLIRSMLTDAHIHENLTNMRDLISAETSKKEYIKLFTD